MEDSRATLKVVAQSTPSTQFMKRHKYKLATTGVVLGTGTVFAVIYRDKITKIFKSIFYRAEFTRDRAVNVNAILTHLIENIRNKECEFGPEQRKQVIELLKSCRGSIADAIKQSQRVHLKARKGLAQDLEATPEEESRNLT